jgi:hypothetical protein
MSFKKTVAIAAAAGALAAISVPAMALENEFHGTYTFNTIFSNFMDGGSGDFNPAFRGQGFTAATIDPTTGQTLAAAKLATKPFGDKRQMNNYLEQRVRLQYTAKVSDDLKLVTHFEINNRFGNINSVVNTQGGLTDVSGSDLDTDGINLVTKHAYLDFNLGSNFNAKTGLMPYKDTIKGIFIDADVPAVMTTTKFNNAYSLALGFARISDASYANTRLGDLSTDLVIMDNTFAFTKDTKAAFSYYLLADYKTADQAKMLNTFGLSGETKLGPVALSGFAAMQAGHQKNQRGTAPGKTSKNYHGYAANLTAKLAVGPGTAKTAFLFVSGDNHSSSDGAHDRAWQNTGVSSFNDGGLMILARATQNSPTSTDRYLRRVITNVALATVGYDANLTDKIYANGNVGFAWAPASASSTLNPNNNGGDFMGTEINLETGYKVNSNLTLRAQAAYAILGAYYTKATYKADGGTTPADPENPYTMRLLASFKF